ncbi:MAG: hypothetical protein ACKJSG_02805 [Lentisphaeria bacterium]
MGKYRRLYIGLLVICLFPGAEAQELDGPATIYNQKHEAVLVDGGGPAKDKSRLVKDAEARTGWALLADPAATPGEGYMWYEYTYMQGPGRLRGNFRLKVADNTNPAVVAMIRGLIGNSELKTFEDRYEKVSLKGTDFAKPNTYQEFSIEFLKGEQGFGDWGLETTGATKVWFDGITVEQLSRFSTRQLLPLIEQPIRPDGLKLATDKLRVHETYGLFMQHWGVDKAVGTLGGERTQSHLNVHPQSTRLDGFPKTWEALYRHRVIVLNNVPAKAVTIVGTTMLRQYVRDGGTVVIMGDTHGISHGGWARSVLGALLPVTPGAPVRAGEPIHLTPRQGERTEFDWSQKPYTLYSHHAEVRPGARVLLAAGAVPLIVERRVGQGRIIVLLMSVLGEVDAEMPGTPFWQWGDWPELIAKLLLSHNR